MIFLLFSFFSLVSSSLAKQTAKKEREREREREKQLTSTKQTRKAFRVDSYGQRMNSYYMYKYDHPRRKMSKIKDGAQQPQYDGGGAGGGDGDGVSSTRDDGDGGDMSSTGDGGGGGSSTACDDGDRDDGDGEGGRSNCRCCCTLQSSFGSAPSKCPSPILSML